MKLTKSKKGIAPIIWAVVVVAGLFGVGVAGNAFKPTPPASSISTLFGLPDWLIMALLFVFVIWLFRK